MATDNGRTLAVQPYLLPPDEAEGARTRVRMVVTDPNLYRLVLGQLAAAQGIEVTGAGGGGDDRPADVAVIDLPDAGYGAGAPALDGEMRPVAVVSGDSDESLLEAASAGAWAAVRADAPVGTLADTVQRVGRGECPILETLASRPAAAGTLLAWIRAWTASTGAPRGVPNPLTDREATILQGVATGSNSGVIAGELGLSEQTVKNYVADILQKVGARNRAQAAALAVRNGWLEELE